MSPAVAIAWFRRDLRINDNPALAAACEADLVVPVFCFERGLHSGRHASPGRNAFLLASLRELDAAAPRRRQPHALALGLAGECRSRAWRDAVAPLTCT